jgi:hypothetical protein
MIIDSEVPELSYEEIRTERQDGVTGHVLLHFTGKAPEPN